MRNLKKLQLLIALFLLVDFLSLFSCGGGGSGSHSSSTAQPQSVSQSASGIWTGNVLSPKFGNTSVTGIVSQTDEVFFISEQGAQHHGQVTVSGSSFSGSLTSYAPIGFRFPDGSSVTTTTVSGTVTTKSSLTGNYNGGGDSGTFSLSYSSLYDRQSSLALVAGNWRAIDGSATFSFSSSGQITGSDVDGCTYTGQISVINQNFNAYKVTVTIAACGSFNGSYSGLAALSDTSASNDTLTGGVSNSTLSIVTVLRKQ